MYRSLQTSRAAAALLVCVFHALACITDKRYFDLPAAAAPFSWGLVSVEYFFVLSGFILLTVHQPDIGRPNRLVPYLIKRAVRIYPTYVIISGGVLLAAWAIPSFGKALPHDPIDILKGLLLLPVGVDGVAPPVTWGQAPSHRILTVAWSLEYEVFFYALFALLLLGRVGSWIVGSLLVVGLCGGFLGFPLPRIGHLLTSPYTLTFMIGLFAAWIHRRGFRAPRPTRLVPILVVLLFILQSNTLGAVWPTDHLRAACAATCSALLILALIGSEEQGGAVGGHPWIQLTGDSSYALYLMHYPLVSLMTRIAMALGLKRYGLPGAAVLFVAEMVACVGSAVLFHRVIERPMLGWFREKTRPWMGTSGS